MSHIQVPLSSIDFDDEVFRITENLRVEMMMRSLEAAGLIHPVVLLEGSSGPALRIVCGFRRLHALRRMGVTGVTARLLRAEDLTTLGAYLMAVWDNLSHRQFSALESARVLLTLQERCGVPQAELVARYLPLLGLPAHQNVLSGYLRLNRLHPELRRQLDAGHLTVKSAERLARREDQEQAGVAAILAGVRLSASLQREVLDLAEDLASMSGGSPAAVLGDSEIAACARDSGLSPFQRGEKIHALLYRKRNPRLSGARDRFHAEKAGLNLPGAIRVSPDPYFERPRLRVEFDVDSAQAFRDAVAALDRACEAGSLDRLFQV